MPTIRLTNNHRYKIEGDSRVDPTVSLPSCSTISRLADSGGSDGLMFWAVDQYIRTKKRDAFRAMRDEAAAFGTAVHAEIQTSIETTLSPEDPSDLWTAWDKSMSENGICFSASELMVYHGELGYGGTIDALGWMDGRLGFTLFDWKTTTELDGKGRIKEFNNIGHAVQLGGYALALEDQYNRYSNTALKDRLFQVSQAAVVYLFKDTGNIRWKWVDLERAKETFLACATLYQQLQEGGLYDRVLA